MQQEPIQIVALQIPKRHLERLSHLCRESSLGVIGNTRRVLSRSRRELGLQVQILAHELAVACRLAAQARSHARAYACFVVVLRLTCCVDAPKSESDRGANEGLGVAFFPRGAVKDPGDGHVCDGGDEVFHAPGCLRIPSQITSAGAHYREVCPAYRSRV